MSGDIIITVLTPTYNRANTLPRLIESLCEQTCMDFQWLVVDDGSTDGTERLFDELRNKELPFQWEYHRKVNGGKHTALNAAHPYIKGEVVLILDSDDYLTEDAVETVAREWPQYQKQNDVCGLSYFKGESKETHLSVENPKSYYVEDHIHYRVNQGIKGDHCEVVRTDLLKKYSFPEYPGERFMAESWLWNHIGMNYKTVYRNKTIYICEYLEGGLTKSGRALRMKCPFGMMDDCRSYLNDEVRLKVRIKEMLLYWVYAKCAGYSFGRTLSTSGRLVEMMLTALPGMMLYSYWKRKYLK